MRFARDNLRLLRLAHWAAIWGLNEPANRAGPVSGPVEKIIFFSTVHMGNFSPVTEMNKARTFKFRPGNRAGVFIWENFQLGYRDLGRKNRDVGNRASPPSHMNTSKFL